MKYDRIIRSGRAGIFTAPVVMGPLRAAAKRAGVAWYDLGLSGVGGREAFFDRCAVALELPSYFGRNLDALHECLLDRAAAGSSGGIVHWHGGRDWARREPGAVASVLEVLRDAAGAWGVTGRCFIVAVERASAPGAQLPPLR
jgi:RNAse (barnase) inhibitor barstar